MKNIFELFINQPVNKDRRNLGRKSLLVTAGTILAVATSASSCVREGDTVRVEGGAMGVRPGYKGSCSVSGGNYEVERTTFIDGSGGDRIPAVQINGCVVDVNKTK